MIKNCGNCRHLSPCFSGYRNFRNLTFPFGPSMLVFCLLLYLTPPSFSASVPLEAILAQKRVTLTNTGGDNAVEEGFSEYESKLAYDGFPIVVPKRAALILDRILKEIESAKESNQLINDWSPISRRGNNKDKLYFRCYFNAVSCYKRK